MFGYVNVLQDELKIKEYKVFKAYYCGLCKRQGELFGNTSRLSLSYDFTALAIILDSLNDEPARICEGRCMLHPLQKRPVAKNCDALSYSAAMSVALSYFKIKDDIADSGFSARAAALPVFAGIMKKVRKEYPEKTAFMAEKLNALAELEKAGCKNIDLPAKEFGDLMSELFAYGDRDIRVLKSLGYNLGRWLYIIDAMDDFDGDMKKNRYNPFADREQVTESLPSLWYNMSEIAASYELLNIKINKPLTDNIIYYGIKASTERVLEKYKNNKD